MKPTRIVRNAWTPSEIEILKSVYPSGGPEAVHEILPNRAIGAIREKCHQLGIRINPEETARRVAETQRRLMNMRKSVEADVTPPEYLQASDIFQVGYRVAKDMGVVHEFA